MLSFKIITFIKGLDWIWNKQEIQDKVVKEFNLIQDRKVFHNENLAIRFSYSATGSFSNTVISLSMLEKYDWIPFLVCLVWKKSNKLFIMNSSFIKKVSHSSKELRVNNIKGSINWSDIMKEINWIKNNPENFDFLYLIHKERTFKENLELIVENTNWIVSTKSKFVCENLPMLFNSIDRATSFIESKDFSQLKEELDNKVEKFSKEILIASYIENTNIRGRVIEYIIAGENEKLKESIILELHKNNNISNIPRFKTKNELWDFKRIFDLYETETDIKTKVLTLKSNPKGCNIDKLLKFLSKDKTIFLFYFIWINGNNIAGKDLVSIFDTRLQKGIMIQHHWAGRGTRGVIQFNWSIIHKVIEDWTLGIINKEECGLFLNKLISL